MRRITLVKTVLFGVVLSGCATNDAALVRQIEELRQQMAEMRAKQSTTPEQRQQTASALDDEDPFGLGKRPDEFSVSSPKTHFGAVATDSESSGVPTLYPAPTRPTHSENGTAGAVSSLNQPTPPTGKTIESVHSGTTPAGLPIIRLSPSAAEQPESIEASATARQGGPARIANALSPGAAKKTKSAKTDIALPQQEPLTFQTIDSEGNVHGRRHGGSDDDEFDDAQWDMETDESEREVRVTGVEPIRAISPPMGARPSAKTPFVPPTAAVSPTVSQQKQEITQPKPNPVVTSETPAAIPTTPALLYSDGISLLKERRHGDAIARFEQLVVDYPEHGLADNALYWKAEAYYDQQQFDAALPVFQEVITRFPLGNKVPDAMVKVGLCLQNLGQPDQARRVLREVLELYPKSDAAQVAQERLPAI